ncbi:response regulator transcription factor [Nitratireductor sp. L1-7-SE]|uniref:Response regulator transcription factor n=1 Tax=Nitratireductor rhodophyticola TaxID=2854036 RepID=A0ABS7R2L9_9HYPH|nr:response regulator transcription factor [Nitratireductor rhodophyticola]MBY8915164.1 response regulator transcription factor [Nitratireductor rhodophyticola]MBY8919766.1 response regulator transcription factor [Nitratireductor rhodophyticola]
MHFLIVEDTRDVAEAIERRLEKAGHVSDRAETLEDAEHFVAMAHHDLIVLDINLPDGSGIAFLKKLRAAGNRVPVLVLTARLAVNDKIDALDLGADDYMIKPFDLGELEARIRAIIRRRSGDADRTLVVGKLTFDMAARRVLIDGEPCELTRREQTLLEIFLTNRDRVLEKEDLLTRLFGHDEERNPNAVELYVGRLRRKIEGSGLEIRTLRGLGYQAVTMEPGT